VYVYIYHMRENRNTIKNGDYWRLDFSRVEWHITIVTNPNGTKSYWKQPVPCENWVWSPIGVVDMHLPEWWGYIQFSDRPVNATVVKQDEQWPIRSALMQIYYAQTNLFAKKKVYSTSLLVLEQYGLPPIVTKGICTKIPMIILDSTHGFIASAQHKQHERVIGHVRSDRLLWFSN